MNENEKSKTVLNAEDTFKELNLICLEVIKELDEVKPRLNNLVDRVYTIPRKVIYKFTYNLLGKRRELIITRLNGNSQYLTTNIRKEILRQIEKELEEMEGWIKINNNKGDK